LFVSLQRIVWLLMWTWRPGDPIVSKLSLIVLQDV
jgi:hypothetical protein